MREKKIKRKEAYKISKKKSAEALNRQNDAERPRKNLARMESVSEESSDESEEAEESGEEEIKVESIKISESQKVLELPAINENFEEASKEIDNFDDLDFAISGLANEISDIKKVSNIAQSVMEKERKLDFDQSNATED